MSLQHYLDETEDWPPDAEQMYERIEALGRGSFGAVWMARRTVPPADEYDDEYVALKNIEIKEEKGYIYARREISILSELHHPNIIRLIRAFPVWMENSQLVVMQLARGPNLNYLVTQRGALGLPLSRLISRQLIAAVSYLHGRGVLHRDIKPTNCILENTQLSPQKRMDWLAEDVLWSDGPDAEASVASNKWRLMLVDFGFARALEENEFVEPKNHMRQSIVNEGMNIADIARQVAEELENEENMEICNSKLREDKAEDLAFQAVQMSMAKISAPLSAVIEASQELVSEDISPRRKTVSTITPSLVAATEPDSPTRNVRERFRRQSSARKQLRSMSALGTRAYAAPEIRHELRTKTPDDINIPREALTDCVADYGMIVDAYSVGWTLRVVLTGVPPNYSISKYMEKVRVQEQPVDTGCWCCRSKAPVLEPLKLRDPSDVPKEATHLVNMLTEKNPDERMTVREAQTHPWIAGAPDETPYVLPTGDIPAKHGDPVVPLKCAKSLM